MASDDRADQPEEQPEAEAKIIFRVGSQDGEQVCFQARPSRTLRKLMLAYCKHQSLDITSAVFLFNGKWLRKEQTLPEVGISGGDVIKVIVGKIFVRASFKDDDAKVTFLIRRSTPLGKLMRAFCERNSLDISRLTFVFDGSRLWERQTPEQVGLRDGGCIRVVQTINVHMRLHGGAETSYRVRPSQRTRKLMHAFCSSNSLDFSRVAFTHGGSQLREEQTFQEAGIGHNCCIDAVQRKAAPGTLVG